MKLHDDIVAVGGVLSTESLIKAYRQGIFPWPIDGLPLTWFCPVKRAILDFSKMRISKSLTKLKSRHRWTITRDQNFREVIQECANTPRPGQDGTWITPELLDAYVQLHRDGFAHSFEVWNGNELVGGIYGVDADGAFSAESMFFREPGASKIALMALIDHLKTHGATWIDIQVMTPHMEKLGAHEISRPDFLKLLRLTRSKSIILF